MEKKNQKLFIIVGVLLLSVGVSLAYFTSKVLNNGEGAETNVTTASINGAKLNIEGVLEFTDVDILPGHKSISGVKITATGNNELIPYNLIWQGTNTLTTPLNFTVYKTSEKIDVTSTCNKKTQIISGAQALSEECNISNIDKLGTEISSGVINKGDTKVTLVKDEFITAYSTGNNVYYYIILEYPNLDEPQNNDIGGTLEGKITVEKGDKKPDINILATYVVQEDGTYKEVEDIPQEGYAINQEKSTCSNGAIPSWDNKNKGLLTTNLAKSGTACYLYFDKLTTNEDTLKKLGITGVKNQTDTAPNFGSIATTDEGIFRVEDGMYGGKSVYWRGAATTNHVIFANKCWRIIRINGDGSIRLIYNGTPSGTAPSQTCPGNGSNSGSIAITDQSYSKNAVSNRSEYIGYTYTIGEQRPTEGKTIEESNLKIHTEQWFDTNITGNDLNKIDLKGKYCNDRNVQAGQRWKTELSLFNYAAYERLEVYENKTPTLSCDTEDVYTLKAGAITADEVAFAGGVNDTDNEVYYLFSGKPYWTMSPHSSDYSRGVKVFFVDLRGNFRWLNLNYNNVGIRPVINLRSDVTFEDGGEGTSSKPYIVQ